MTATLVYLKRKLFSLRRTCLCALGTGILMLSTVYPSSIASDNLLAPSLEGLTSIQGPEKSQLNWQALRGRVVVLEFWATWCGPCIEAMPHLNQVMKEMDPKKFQLITIDDEDQSVIRRFINKRQINGWVEADATGTTFKRYKVAQRPWTVVIDATGHVAGVAQPSSLDKADLLAVAAKAKPEHITQFATALPNSELATTEPSAILFEALVQKSQGGDQTSMSANNGVNVIREASARFLLAHFFEIPDDRIIAARLPEDRYDVYTTVKEGTDTRSSGIRTAITSALDVDVQWVQQTRSVLVLRNADPNHVHLLRTASNGGVVKGFWDRKVHLVKGSTSDIAEAVETALSIPVIDESQIRGKYDAEFLLHTDDLNMANADLLHATGLKLVRDQRLIKVLVVKQSNLAH